MAELAFVRFAIDVCAALNEAGVCAVVAGSVEETLVERGHYLILASTVWFLSRRLLGVPVRSFFPVMSLMLAIFCLLLYGLSGSLPKRLDVAAATCGGLAALALWYRSKSERKQRRVRPEERT